MKVLWLLLMVCGAAHAQAQGWRKLADNDQFTTYVHGGSLVRAPSGKPAVWAYYAWARPLPNGAVSSRVLIEADCRGLQFRVLSWSDHSEALAEGRVLGSRTGNTWESVPPGTVAAVVWEFACAGK